MARTKFGPLFPVLRASGHRSLYSKMNPRRRGTPARDGANKIRPSVPRASRFRASVFVLKNEPAEVRDSCTGWREQNSALCSQCFALQGIGLCTRYTAMGGVAPPQCSADSHGETHPLYQGAEF